MEPSFSCSALHGFPGCQSINPFFLVTLETTVVFEGHIGVKRRQPHGRLKRSQRPGGGRKGARAKGSGRPFNTISAKLVSSRYPPLFVDTLSKRLSNCFGTWVGLAAVLAVGRLVSMKSKRNADRIRRLMGSDVGQEGKNAEGNLPAHHFGQKVCNPCALQSSS